ncbi:MAG: DUF418 domain-containing protein [Ilumatobacteraceae bacterium]
MAVKDAPLRSSAASGSRRRLPGPDVVRAVALIGVVVMNYHGYLILRGGSRSTDTVVGRLFDPWTGPLATRFAATFVLVAGVGVTLMTRRALGDPARVRELRWTLVRRGLLLYLGGLFLEEIWPGTIIPFYGGMFVIAAALFTLRSRWLLAVGVVAALAGWAIRTWRFWRAEDGDSMAWLTSPGGSARGYVFDLFVNGTHPLLPWLAFMCAGMLLGRILTVAWWRPATLGAGFALYSVSTMMAATATTEFQLTVLSTDPYDRGLVYLANALGTALIAYAVIDWLAEWFTTALDPLRRAGQMTLTLYIAHVLVFNFVVDWMGWIEPGGLDIALAFALAFWVAGIATATWWSRHLGRGPAERVYRMIGG